MEEKIVVLNSGGFDSIVLMNYIHTVLGFKNLYSLHFKYGALNEEQQLKCVNKVCEKLNIPNKVIELPPFNWSNSNFFDSNNFDLSTQYVEYRNLIFISYAISYAESIGADRVFVAFLNQWDYPDTTPEFIQGLNFLSEKISVEAPFHYNNKEVLGHFAKYLGISEDDYFSCDDPVNGKPCGKCLDCVALKDIREKLK